ncbi:Lysophospholipid acyltransferase LPEAT1 [Platanthera guangdongensis]|uniref:Lysophospholipid acyltransferase LPEAT1 n=1 Tax=Platanthera guangdongensis TaxID=2320717 RepID=A0ABR2M8G1_9ASPA
MGANDGFLGSTDVSPAPTDLGLGRSGKAEQPLLKPESSVFESSPVSRITAKELEEMEKKYGAYVRKDAFGIMGRGELTIADKFLLGIAMVTLVPIRVVVGIYVLLVYYLICRFCTAFSVPNRREEQEDYAHMTGWRREIVVRCGRFLSRVMLFNFGFYWIKETRLQSAEVLFQRARLFDSSLGFVLRSESLKSQIIWLDLITHEIVIDSLNLPMVGNGDYDLSKAKIRYLLKNWSKTKSIFPNYRLQNSWLLLPVTALHLVVLDPASIISVVETMLRESKASDFKGVSGDATSDNRNGSVRDSGARDDRRADARLPKARKRNLKAEGVSGIVNWKAEGGSEILPPWLCARVSSRISSACTLPHAPDELLADGLASVYSILRSAAKRENMGPWSEMRDSPTVVGDEGLAATQTDVSSSIGVIALLRASPLFMTATRQPLLCRTRSDSPSSFPFYYLGTDPLSSLEI